MERDAVGNEFDSFQRCLFAAHTLQKSLAVYKHFIGLRFSKIGIHYRNVKRKCQIPSYEYEVTNLQREDLCFQNSGNDQCCVVPFSFLSYCPPTICVY